MIKTRSVVLLSLLLTLACQVLGRADVFAQNWQRQSLKGITSINYGVVGDSSESMSSDVDSAFSKLKVKKNSMQDLCEMGSKPLSINEAIVKVIAQDRKNNQCWVGLTVEQRCQLERTPSIQVAGETYKIDKMCPRGEVKNTVKELCTQFVKDFSAQSEFSR